MTIQPTRFIKAAMIGAGLALSFASAATAGDFDYAIKHGGNDATRAAARLLAKGDAERAIPILNGVLSKDVRTAVQKIAQNNLCVGLSMTGDQTAAVAACDAALAFDGGYWEALVNRGAAHALAGDRAAALADFEAAKALVPGKEMIARNIATAEAAFTTARN